MTIRPDNKAVNRKTGVLLSASFFNSDRMHQWVPLFLRILKGINDRADVFTCSSVESCCSVFMELSFPCLELLFLLLETVVPKAWHSCATVLSQPCHHAGPVVPMRWHKPIDRTSLQGLYFFKPHSWIGITRHPPIPPWTNRNTSYFRSVR